MSDLISREALKKELNSRVFQGDYTTTLLLSSFNDLIDNAPTIPLPDFKEGYKQAIIDGKTNFSKPLRADLIYHGNPMEWKETKESSSWIPIKTKKLSPEEIREFCEKTHEFSPEEMDGAWSFDCKLPEKTQDVLVTTRYEDVVITKFVCDGCEWYFEDFEDEGDLLAWMPLPEP